MDHLDIRWKQRFENFSKALERLGDAVALSNERQLSKLEDQGLIQAFEFTFELAWNVIKDYFDYQAEENIRGSRDAFRIAFNRGLIENGETWMEMISSRIQSTHTYDEEIASSIVKKIRNQYFDCFVSFSETMKREL